MSPHCVCANVGCVGTMGELMRGVGVTEVVLGGEELGD